MDNKHCPGHAHLTDENESQDDEATPPPSSSSSSGSSGSSPSAALAPPLPPSSSSWLAPAASGAAGAPMGGGGAAGAAETSESPFKCHLCEEGYAERSDVLTHLQTTHADEFNVLVAKGALDASGTGATAGSGSGSGGGGGGSAPANGHTSDEGEDYDSVRGKFPDYVNRKVTCAFCLRRFWSAEDLRRHMRTHTGERPFHCDVCSRRFTLKHSMLRHRRKHDASATAADDDAADEDSDDASDDAAAKLLTLKMRPASDLIGNLLGIPDASLVETLMSKPADDAARLLGVGRVADV